ncbi:MAG: AAA family ATPase [Deinococcales bacterium]
MDTSTEDALFGPWLRRRRKALDLTQKELARLVGCSLHTVRKLESGVRRPSKPVAGAIARATGVPDNEHDAFVRFARAGGADDAQDTRRPDLERPWLVESATEAGPARPDGDVTAPSTATAPARPVERPESDLDDEAPASPLFLARSAELDRLQGALNDALNGHGRVMLIAGEAGQGKTSLMKAFAGRAQAANPELLAVVGTCNAYTGTGDPFAPFREILAQLTGHVPSGADRTRFDANRRARLRAFLPRALASVLDHGPDLLDTLLPLAPLRSRLTDAGIALPDRLTTFGNRASASPLGGQNAAALRSEAVDVLAHTAAHAPLLLLLDDLQWADEHSLELLLQLARTSPTTRILIIGACRTGEVSPSDGSASPVMQRVIHGLTRQFGDIRVDLDRADTRAFLDAWLDTEPNDLGPAFRDALLRQTGGQPLFTIELLRAMQQRGDLIRDAEGRWIEGPELRWDALPARVAGALGERITRLDPSARQVLTAAGIEGETFTVEVVARVLDLDPLDVARVSSNELEQEHRLVELADVSRLPGGQRVSRYRFRHNLIQRYVLDHVGAAERSYLHEKVAAATEALMGEDADPLALAYHYTEAHATALAAPHLRKAGDRARSAFALTDAIHSYRSALDAWPEADTEGRAELLYDLAQCLSLHGDPIDAERILEKSLAEYERLGDRRSSGAIRAEIMRIVVNRPPENLRMLDAFHAWLPLLEKGPESPELAFLLTRIAESDLHEHDDRALAVAERGLAVAERLGSDRHRAQGLMVLGWVLACTRSDRHDDALARIQEAVEVAERIGAFVEVGSALSFLGAALESYGRLEEVRAVRPDSLVPTRLEPVPVVGGCRGPTRAACGGRHLQPAHLRRSDGRPGPRSRGRGPAVVEHDRNGDAARDGAEVPLSRHA